MAKKTTNYCNVTTMQNKKKTLCDLNYYTSFSAISTNVNLFRLIRVVC